MEFDKNNTVCFTGNRPNKLPWGYDENAPACVSFKNKLRQQIEKLIQKGYKTFIVGMAEGVDTYVAEILLDIKSNSDIVIIGAIQYLGQEKQWTSEAKNRYNQILQGLDTQMVVSEHFSKYALLKRNKYMLDNSSVVVAASTGQKGGTTYTISLAQKMNKEIIFVSI